MLENGRIDVCATSVFRHVIACWLLPSSLTSSVTQE